MEADPDGLVRGSAACSLRVLDAEAKGAVSALLESLKDAIKNMVWSGEIRAEMAQATINSRHQDSLQRARAATRQTIEELKAGSSLELAALDLRIAVNAIGEIVGKTTTDDLLDSIFSQFCIGK